MRSLETSAGELGYVDDFLDFVFANPVRFWGESNPAFFEGTIIEEEAAAELTGVR